MTDCDIVKYLEGRIAVREARIAELEKPKGKPVGK